MIQTAPLHTNPEDLVGSMLIPSVSQPPVKLLLQLDAGSVAATPSITGYDVENFQGDIQYALELRANSPTPNVYEIYFLTSFIQMYQASLVPPVREGDARDPTDFRRNDRDFRTDFRTDART